MPSDPVFTVRPFEPPDEQGWLRCRVLAFPGTAYFDGVYRKKERYGSRAVELVAEAGGQIVGLIDVECEDEPGSICSETAESGPPGPAGMIRHLAVHPDCRRLLVTAAEQAKEWGIARFEAWTRDDPFVNEWYRAMGFRWVQSYHHVYMTTRDEVAGSLRTEVPALQPVKVLAHYVGADEELPARFQRVHRCNRYDLSRRGAQSLHPGEASHPSVDSEGIPANNRSLARSGSSRDAFPRRWDGAPLLRKNMEEHIGAVVDFPAGTRLCRELCPAPSG